MGSLYTGNGNRYTMNLHYYNRYIKFINNIPVVNGSVYETHHIHPKCLGGSDDKSNLIRLTPRQHYIAHMLLAFAYRDNLSVVSAFCQMAHKNTRKKTRHILRHRTFSSRIYQKLKTDFYKMISHYNKGMVNVRDSDGNLHRISSEEYKNSNYQFHTKGKVYVYSLAENKMMYISSELYRKNKLEYRHPLSGKSKIYDAEIWIQDNETGLRSKVSYSEWNIIRNITYSRFGKIKPCKKYKMVKAFTDEWKYKTSIARKETFQVFDTTSDKNIIIHKNDYNPEIHNTSTKNHVLINDNGNAKLITKEEYATGKYQGITKGYCKVIDIQTNKIVLIPQSLKQQYPDRYIGHMTGKIAVVDKNTGNRIIINKEEFDKVKYCALGNKQFLFRGIVIETNKPKNINYFEYLKYNDKFNIIDYNKFNKIHTELDNS